MNASERMTALFKGDKIDRLPVMEWAPWWNLTLERWQKEGLSVDIKSYNSCLDIQRHFGLDACVQTYFSVRTALSPQPSHHGAGIMRSQQDYAKIKKTLYPASTSFYNKDYYKWLKQTRDEGDTVHFFTVEGFFWFPRELFGIEPHMFSYYDYPELLKEMCYDYQKWLKEMFEYIGNTFRFDFMSFAEDMSYNNGPMLGKDKFDEFLAPYYKNVIPQLKKLNIPVFIDSDGDITKAVDWYAGVGADGMFPLERQAGVEVSLYLKKQPEMFFLGHFDKMCMKFGESAMRKEFERLLPSMLSKRFIPSVDHQTPPDVSMENYKIYVKLLKEYAQKVN